MWGSKTLAAELQRCTNTLKPFMETLYNKDSKFADYFNLYLSNLKIWAFNLFIGKKEILNEWLNFFFDVLIDFEKKCPIGPGTRTYRREGYFAEFMFGAWLEYKGYKIIPCDINKLNKYLSRSELYCKKFY